MYIGEFNLEAAMTTASVPLASRKWVRQTRRSVVHLPAHPSSPDPQDLDQIRGWLASLPRPWAVDLFAGAGGLSLGLIRAGFSVVAAADADADALATHRANIPSLSWDGDLAVTGAFERTLERWGIAQVDLVAGGPPCQPFSRAGVSKISNLVRSGHRDPRDGRRDLWQSFFRVVDALSPRAILFENVPDMARFQEGAILIRLLQEMEKRGYTTSVRLLEAWKYRVPQHRTRLLVVGVRDGGSFNWPEPLGQPTTVRDAIGDLPPAPPGQTEAAVPYSGAPGYGLAKLLRSGLIGEDCGIIWDHETREVRPDDAEAFSLLREGQAYRDLPARLQRYRADIFDDKYFRLSWDGLSRTITAHLAKDGYWYIHPEQNRTLSVREAARIQTFPDDFRFVGSMTSRFRQIGNAVPPLLAEAVGRSLRNAVVEPPESQPEARRSSQFRTALSRWHGRHARSFPWRNNRDPWPTLLAEVCLHRTKAEQVAGVFERLHQLAPTPSALRSNSTEFRKAAEPLGLAWRIDCLLESAAIIEDRYGGVPPRDWSALKALPGVGDYVAAAVMCFAYRQPAVLLDTNTARIARRLVGTSNMKNWEARLELHKRSGRKGPDAAWNYALLDLGGTICTAHRPKCGECPVSTMCEAGKARSFPAGAK